MAANNEQSTDKNDKDVESEAENEVKDAIERAASLERSDPKPPRLPE